MGIFDKLFGRKRSQPPALPATGSPDSENDGMITAYDGYGREIQITKSAWVDSVLLPGIQKAWNNPDELAGLIISGMHDGYFAQLLPAADHLARMDPNPERGHVLHAIVLLKCGKIGESEKVLKDLIAKHGETGVALTNLAKIHAERHDEEKVLETLWRGLELDPNQDNALGWYEVLHREKHGEAAGREALRRIAGIPGSWRALVWLGRASLEDQDPEEAVSFYRKALEIAPRPIPTDLLMQMSGDLGSKGHLLEMVNLTAPCYRPEVHGLSVGNNLIKAYLDLGQLEQSRGILEGLYGQRRPDWNESLRFWDEELSKASLELKDIPPPEDLKIEMGLIEGPVWFSTEVRETLAVTPTSNLRLAIIAATIEQPPDDSRRPLQQADSSGRISRALPLLIAERIYTRAGASVVSLFPWMSSPYPCFAIIGEPWKPDQASQTARQGETPADYVLTLHLIVHPDNWSLQTQLARSIDSRVLGSVTTILSQTDPWKTIDEWLRNLEELLSREADFTFRECPPYFTPPSGPALNYYLLRLEQLLAIRFAPEEPEHSFLTGEREFLSGNLQLCLEHPESPLLRLLLARTCQSMAKIRPEVVGEFRERVRLLQKDHPIQGPVSEVVDKILEGIPAMS